MAEQVLHGDKIDVVIKQVASDNAINNMCKDGHDRAPLGRSASNLPTHIQRAGVSHRCVTAKPRGRYAACDALGRAACVHG